MSGRSRAWCFTVNNPVESDGSPVTGEMPEFDKVTDARGFRYIVYQLERGGEEGTPHYQGYVVFTTLKSRAWVSNLNPTFRRARLEKARGSAEDNTNYCTKEEGRLAGPWTTGEMPAQGKRTDIDTYVEAMKEVNGEMDLVTELETFTGIVAKYPRFTNHVRKVYQPRRDWLTEVFVYYGDAGAGKTRRAIEEAGESYYSWMDNEKGFFDGYTGEDNVILDDYEGQIKFSLFKKLIDRYAMTVEVKGSSVNWKPRKIWITSNHHWTNWYSETSESSVHYDALARRISKLVLFKKVGIDDAGNNVYETEDELVV